MARPRKERVRVFRVENPEDGLGPWTSGGWSNAITMMEDEGIISDYSEHPSRGPSVRWDGPCDGWFNPRKHHVGVKDEEQLKSIWFRTAEQREYLAARGFKLSEYEVIKDAAMFCDTQVAFDKKRAKLVASHELH